MHTEERPLLAEDMLEEAIAAPTLDDYMKRDPAEITEVGIREELVPLLRADRARFISASNKRKRGGREESVGTGAEGTAEEDPDNAAD